MAEGRSRASVTDVFRVPEFRALWVAELLSICGDQLARVALSAMVFASTRSAALTSLTYALTYAPSLVGGILLAGVADRRPRREVMVLVDAVRAGLIVLVAIPGVPFWALCLLVGSVAFLNPVFKAAQLAVLPDLLSGERYEAGMAVRQITIQAGQLLGFAGGGLLTAAVSPRAALVLDAGTFAVSAVLLRVGLRPRAAAAAGTDNVSGRQLWLRGIRCGGRLVARDRGVRILVLLCWLMAVITVHEALAAPYAAALGAGPSAIGLLLASDPLGGVIGAYLFNRWVPVELRAKLVGPFAVLAAALLSLCLLRPGLIATMPLLVCSGGLGTVVVMQATTSFTRAVPDADRAQVLGLSNTGLTAATVGWFGIAGTALAIPLAITSRRGNRP